MQGEVSLGRSEDEVVTALNDMVNSINWMVDDVDPGYPHLGKITEAFQHDVAMVRCLDPRKIDEEFNRVRNVARAVGENAELVVNLERGVNHTSGWKGTAADAFRDHMFRMREFATHAQHTALMIGLQSMGALFGMAYHMRQSYYDLAILVRTAAEHEIDEQKERVDKVKLAIGVDFLKAAFSLNPASMTGVMVDFVADAVKDLGDYWIEGKGVDAVINGYLEGSDGLWHTFENELRRVAHRIRGEHGDQDRANAQMQVLQPINQISKGITDVGSPNFSYEHFYTEEYPKDGPFAGKVAEERPKYAEEKQRRDSEINRRLEGRS